MDIKCWFICIENTENQFLTKFIKEKKYSCKYIGKMYFRQMTWFQKFFINMIFFLCSIRTRKKRTKKLAQTFLVHLPSHSPHFPLIFITEFTLLMQIFTFWIFFFSYDVGELQRNSYTESASTTLKHTKNKLSNYRIEEIQCANGIGKRRTEKKVQQNLQKKNLTTVDVYRHLRRYSSLPKKRDNSNSVIKANKIVFRLNWME